MARRDEGAEAPFPDALRPPRNRTLVPPSTCSGG